VGRPPIFVLSGSDTRKLQDSRSLPAKATPDSTSAVLRHTQAQITRQAAASASHRADEGENVVLIPCRDQLAKQAILLACISPHSLRLGRVVPVLPVGPPAARQPLSGARAGAQAAVYPAAAVAHRRGLAWLSISLAPRPATWSRIRELKVRPPAGFLRFTGHFSTRPPGVYGPSLFPRSPPQQRPPARLHST
jgi:hypothetical protein